MKQEVNRKHAGDRWALDDVVMTAEVLHPPRDADAIREPPGEGVYIYGLFLDGAAWSPREGRLVDSDPKKLFCPLPVLHVTGVQARASPFWEVVTPAKLPRLPLSGRDPASCPLKIFLACEQPAPDSIECAIAEAPC